MPGARPHLDTLCVNTIRTLAMDMVEAARSGHPGAPMGLAPAGYALFTGLLRHDPRDPAWPDRDRFILSNGHASALLYSLLFLCGYAVTLEDLRQFRQWGSKTPGHPEARHTPGVETTTGPLGQGIANAVGLAIAERHLAARFNRGRLKVVDHWTYVFCGDGDLMEGVAAEAASLAGHLGLGRLICLWDDNRVTIDGPTALAFSEDVARRFRAYGWQVLRVRDGNDPASIREAFRRARAEEARPSLLVCRTRIAWGSPNKEGSSEAHGAPLGAAEVRLTKERLGFPPDAAFFVPEAALRRFRRCLERGTRWHAAWKRRFETWSRRHPELAAEWDRALAGRLPAGWDAELPDFAGSPPIATRSAFGRVLEATAPRVPELIGGSADLTPSNNTRFRGAVDFQRTTPGGRYLRFGVREHAMGGILSGIFTATEAAAIAVLYAFLVGTLFYREIRLSQLNRILIDSGLTTSIILFIIGTANILAWVLAAQQVPQRLSAFFLSLGSNPYFILFLVNLFLLLVGMFMETGAAVILLSPILHPALVSLGLHPLHVGLVFVLNLSIGLITPPVGVCLFVSSAIGGISIEKLTRAMLPFMVVEVAVLLLVSFLPQTVLLFPKVFGYA